MGSTVPADARYAQTAPCGHPQELAVMIKDYATSPKALTNPISHEVNWGGVFLNTEVDFEDGMTISLQSQTMATSSSLPNLPMVQTLAPSSSLPNLPNRENHNSVGESSVGESSPKAPRTDVKSLVAKRQQKVMKTFNRVMAGKNVLVLTDKPALRKQITRILVSDETSLVFIKSSNDLWFHLRDSQEEYHVLLLDLTKNELQVEPMLRTIRQHTRYGGLQIIVLSQEHEMTEMVRSCCSFAVFLPLAASMLREALVWCFDRKSGRKLFPVDESQEEWDVVRGKAAAGASVHAPVESAVVAVN